MPISRVRETSQSTFLQGKEFLRSQIHVVSSRASKSAIKAIERLGGTVYCKYYNPLAVRDCVEGRTDRVTAAPTKRKDIGMSAFYRQQLGPLTLFQSGILIGETGATSQYRLSRRCHSLTID